MSGCMVEIFFSVPLIYTQNSTLFSTSTTGAADVAGTEAESREAEGTKAEGTEA